MISFRVVISTLSKIHHEPFPRFHFIQISGRKDETIAIVSLVVFFKKLHLLNSSSYNPILSSLSGYNSCTFSIGFHEISLLSKYIVCLTGEACGADMAGSDVSNETLPMRRMRNQIRSPAPHSSTSLGP